MGSESSILKLEIPKTIIWRNPPQPDQRIVETPDPRVPGRELDQLQVPD